MRTPLASKSRSTACPRNKRNAVRASLELNNYDERDISPVQLRAAYRDAEKQIIAALEPFGYYDPKVTPHLTGDEANGWTARFDVVPGDPVIVREERVDVIGEGKERRRVAAALAGFVPKVGERLDHPTYEASKAVIDTSLRGAGYLDAKFTKRRVTVIPEEHSAKVDLQWESGPRYKFGDVRFAGDAPFPEEFLREYRALARRRLLQFGTGAQPSAAAGGCGLFRTRLGAAGHR